MMKKKFSIILTVLLIVCRLCPAGASGFRSTVSFFSSGKSIDFVIKTEVSKLPQFSAVRTEQLNRLLKHISFKGSVDNTQSTISMLLNDHALFSCMELNSSGQKVSMISSDSMNWYILPNESMNNPEESAAVQDDLHALFRNVDIFSSLDSICFLIRQLPAVFPEKSQTAKMQAQTFRDYGRVVKKSTVILTGEELTDYILANMNLFGFLNDYPMLENVRFEGRQSFALFLTEDDRLVMINYSGHSVLNGDDVRTVRLEWKTVRSDFLEKDELQLRTPNSNGTKRNNLILTYEWHDSGEDSESVQWRAETDQVEDGVRTRTFSDATLVFSGSSFTGTLSEKILTGSKSIITEGNIIASVPATDHSSGTLEINHKNDKIEKDRFIIRFELSPGSLAQVSSDQPETTVLANSEATEFLNRQYALIVQELLKLPDEDTAIFREGIPDELWETILP